MALTSIVYDNNKLKIINQLVLPHQTEYEEINSVSDACNAIKSMKVRGAPAIAIVGLLSLSIELGKSSNASFKDSKSYLEFVEQKLKLLSESRPTAVNISKVCKILSSGLHEQMKNGHDIDFLKTFLTDFCEKCWKTDLTDNLSIGNHGATSIMNFHSKFTDNFNVLTHCNTGSLATTGYGTALGVVRKLKELGRLNMLYYTETRPYFQGARLTSYETIHDNIPSTLIVDSSVGILMQTKCIHAVIVGADRVSSNGDVANKIGTLQLAILAKFYSVPFYVATPWSSIDMNLASGSEIVIEERPAVEMTQFADRPITPKSINVWNPAFDVTPGYLITGGFITEKGVIAFDKLRDFFKQNV